MPPERSNFVVLYSRCQYLERLQNRTVMHVKRKCLFEQLDPGIPNYWFMKKILRLKKVLSQRKSKQSAEAAMESLVWVLPQIFILGHI